MIRRLPTLDETVPTLFRVILVGSLYLLFAGHDQPGGGFVGGLVAGAAISLRYIAGGIDEVRHVSRWQPWTILGAGVVVAVSTALVPVAAGSAILDSGYATWDAPVVGSVSVSSALVFDVGVYLCVVGLVLMVFEAFGDRFGAGEAVDGTAADAPVPDAGATGPGEGATP